MPTPFQCRCSFQQQEIRENCTCIGEATVAGEGVIWECTQTVQGRGGFEANELRNKTLPALEREGSERCPALTGQMEE